MLISKIRTKIPLIIWGFAIVFGGSLFYTFGGSLLPGNMERRGQQQRLKGAKINIPREVVKIDGVALDMELFNDSYVRMLETGDFGNIGRNYFTRTYLRSQALDRLIQQEIFLLEAKRRKLKVTSGEVNKDIRNYRDFLLGGSSRLENPGLPSRVKYFVREKDRDKELQKILLRRGVSGKTFKNAMRREALTRKVQKQLAGEAQAKEEADAKKRADEVMAKVRAGEDFYLLATEFSEDISTRSNGGDRGWFRRGTWEKEFENAAFAMGPGQTSDLVKSDSGFHIIRVEGKKIAVGPDFEREKQAFIELLRQELGREPTDADIQNAYEEVKARQILIKTKTAEAILTDWFRAEREKHKVEIINPELKAFRYTMGMDLPEGRERDDNKALALYDDAIKADPTNQYLHYYKGFIYERMYSEAEGKGEEEDDPYAQFADDTEDADDTEKPKEKKKDVTNYMKKALEEYREAYEIAKEKEMYVTDPLLYLAVAHAYEELGQKKKARVYLVESVDFAAGNMGYLTTIEESLVRLGGAKQALSEVRELIAELEPPEETGIHTVTIGEGDEEQGEEQVEEEPAAGETMEDALDKMGKALKETEEKEAEELPVP